MKVDTDNYFNMAIAGLGGGETTPTNQTIDVDVKGNKDKTTTAGSTMQSSEELELANKIQSRFFDMDADRDDSRWDDYQREFEAKWQPSSDGMANSKLPIVPTTIRNKMADERSLPADVTFKPVGKDDIDKMDVTQVTWNYVYNEDVTDQKIDWIFWSKNIFGLGVLFEGLEQEERIIEDPTGINDDGTMTFERKKLVKSNITSRWVDIRRFWIDPVASIEKAEDCIEEEYITFAQLEVWKDNASYKNIGLVTQMFADELSELEFRTDKEEAIGTHSKPKIKLWHYWNEVLDKYVILANEKVVIREQPIPYSHKELPYSIIVNETILGSMGGKGIAETLMNTLAELNATRNMMLDTMKMSSTTNILMGQGVAIDSVENVFGNNIWNFDGDLAQIREFQIREKQGAVVNVNSMLMDDVTIFTGVDNRSLIGSPTKTAFEARLQEQTKLKGMAVSLRNADYFYKRWGEQRLSNIKQFFTTTFAKQIIGISEKPKTTGRNIVIEGKKVVRTTDKKNKKIKLEDSNGFDMLELTGDALRSDLQVIVKTRSTTPILESIRSENTNNVIDNTIKMAQAQQILKESGNEGFGNINWDKLMERVMTDNNLIPEQLMTQKAQTKEDAREQILSKIALPPRTPEPLPTLPTNPQQ